MPLVQTTPPTELPVALVDATEHLRIDSARDRELVTRLIGAATSWVEGFTQRQVLPASWTLYLDRFPDTLELWRGDVTAVTAIKYLDTAGVLQTLAATEYTADLAGEPSRVCPAYGKAWPAIRSEVNAVQVEYVVGYANLAAVPDDIKHAILLMVGELYENRQNSVIGAAVSTNRTTSENLLAPYRMVRFA